MRNLIGIVLICVFFALGSSHSARGANPDENISNLSFLSLLLKEKAYTGASFKIGEFSKQSSHSIFPLIDNVISINNISVFIPSGTVLRECTLNIGTNTGYINPIAGVWSGTNIELQIDDLYNYQKDIFVTIPYSGEIAPIIYGVYDHDLSISAMPIHDIDTHEKTITFRTMHNGIFTLIYPLEVVSKLYKKFSKKSYPTYDTDTYFRPIDNGFAKDNQATAWVYKTKGKCFGMSEFARYYYSNYKNSNFISKYTSIVGQNNYGEWQTGQDVIATRAHSALISNFNSYYWEYIKKSGLTSPYQNLICLNNMLRNTKRPVSLYVYTLEKNDDGTESISSAHVVLAYRIVGLSNGDATIHVYDPNHAKKEYLIDFVWNDGDYRFDLYDGWEGLMIHYNGNLPIKTEEPFRNILEGANSNFNTHTLPFISLLSHTSGDIVHVKDITITGNISSSEALISKIRIKLLNTPIVYVADVPLDGNFSIPIELQAGDNHLIFEPITNNMFNNDIAIVTHNLSTNDFIITLDEPAISNGSFETGDFSFWTIHDLQSPFVPFEILAKDTPTAAHDWDDFFHISPADGQYAAIHGFDGSKGDINLSQLVTVPAQMPFLKFNFIAGWNMWAVTDASLARTFNLKIYTLSGYSWALSQTFNFLHAYNSNTNLQYAKDIIVDLSRYSGQTIKLNFNWNIPEDMSGPGLFQLDNIRMEH